MKLTLPPDIMHLTNQHIAELLGCSHTAVHHAKRAAKGLCQRCTNHVVEGRVLCFDHEAIVDRERRKRLGNNPWKPGGKGRPPKYYQPT